MSDTTPRLRDIDPAAVGQATHDALRALLSRIALWVGVDAYPQQISHTEARMATEQLAHYALTGAYPEGRPELLGEYLQSVAEYADALGEFGELHDPKTPLQVVLAAAIARSKLADDEPLMSYELAVLASLTKGRLSQLQAAGDAPKGRKVRGRQQRAIPADEARSWLSGRGVQGL